ncbi:membrane hypothetical protein [metagenome]|uniref:Uncharacterized protein n=1 Tax=metagenome TaxID=256318 RepID=A0A2P2CAL8_9ZZZZ
MAAEVVLLIVGRVSIGAAVGVLLALETALVAVILSVAWRAARTSRGDRVAAAVRAVLPSPVAAPVLFEIRQLRALWLLVRGRVATEGPSDVTISYAAGRGGAYLMIGAVGAIELVAVHLIVPWHRLGTWAWVQWFVFALSAYGSVWLLAWWAAQRTHPHLITDDELVLRNATLVTLRVPLDLVGHVSPRRRGLGSEGRLMLAGTGGGTNLDIDFVEPTPWRSLTGRRSREVTAVSLEVDDARVAAQLLTRALRRRTQLGPATDGGAFDR